MEKLKIEECKKCEDWNGSIVNCMNICGKPIDALEEFNRYKCLEEQGQLPCTMGKSEYIKKEDVLKVIEDIKCNQDIPKNYGTLLDIMKSIREMPSYDLGRVKGIDKTNDAADIIRRILKKENLNQKNLAERMGITRQNISQMLNRNKVSMRYDSFRKMADALGYEIILRKKQ